MVDYVYAEARLLAGAPLVAPQRIDLREERNAKLGLSLDFFQLSSNLASSMVGPTQQPQQQRAQASETSSKAFCAPQQRQLLGGGRLEKAQSFDTEEDFPMPGNGPVPMPKEVEEDFGVPMTLTMPCTSLRSAKILPIPAHQDEDIFDRIAREQQIFKTLVVTHVECKNHVTPTSRSAQDYLQTPRERDDDDDTDKHRFFSHPVQSNETQTSPPNNEVDGSLKRRREHASGAKVSPEQPERVTAVFEALKQCRWECGGVRLIDPVELSTSPTLASAIDGNLSQWAAPRRRQEEEDLSHEKSVTTSKRGGPPQRTSSVSYLFDDIEPIVLSVHDIGYLSRVASEIESLKADDEDERSPRKRKLFRCVSMTATGDTFASSRSLHAALCATFSVCRAVDAVVSREYRNAFCCVRPPGHHAGPQGSTCDDAGDLVGQGFCLINNVAVAARYALANHPSIKRIAIIDWDLHHGNGTEEIFCSKKNGALGKDVDHYNDSIKFCSIHGATPSGVEPKLFPGTGLKSTSSSDDSVNVPLPAGTGHTEFLERFNEHVIPAAEAFNPDLIMISAGFDGHKDDLFKFFKLSDKTFKLMTEAVVSLANRVCEGRVVSVLEGGYNIPTLVRCCMVHVRALATYKQPLPVVNRNLRAVASSETTLWTSPTSDAPSSSSSSYCAPSSIAQGLARKNPQAPHPFEFPRAPGRYFAA